jgi:hypothetical protein
MALKDGQRFMAPQPRGYYAIPPASAEAPAPKPIDTQKLIAQKHEEDLRRAEASKPTER